MNKTPWSLLAALALTCLVAAGPAAIANTVTPAATIDTAVVTDDTDAHRAPTQEHQTRVSFGHDTTLAAGEHADEVVAILGSASSAGQVNQVVVSVLGNTRVTGPVGDQAVAVLGNTYVDSHVGGNVVAVLGDVELGPHAEVGGDVVAVGGALKRDPAAIIHGDVQNVMLFGSVGGLEWLHAWVKNCLLYARPLAFAPGLGWAWTLAFSFLAFYLLIALLFPAAVNRCVQTMEAQPGRTVLAALFTFLLKPIVFLLVLVTVVGALLLPFLAFALLVAGFFGKAVALAWLGRRVLPHRNPDHPLRPALAVLVGGLIALLLYVLPVFGFVAYKVLGILGLGIVVYTLLLGYRSARAASGAAPAPAAAPPPGAQAAAAEAATQAGAPEVLAPATPAAPPPARPASIATAQRAGFWIRMLALLLDLILVGIVWSIISSSHHGHRVLLPLAAYGAIMWRFRGTTIGGIVCNLRVVRLDGRAIDWPTAIVRALGCFLSMAVAGLGFIWVVFDPERQSWHDKIAGTVVVRSPRGTPLV